MGTLLERGMRMVPYWGGSLCPGLPPPCGFGVGPCVCGVADVPVKRADGAFVLGVGGVCGLSFVYESVWASCYVGSSVRVPGVCSDLGAAPMCAYFPLGRRRLAPLCRLGLSGCGSVLAGRVRIVRGT